LGRRLRDDPAAAHYAITTGFAGRRAGVERDRAGDAVVRGQIAPDAREVVAYRAAVGPGRREDARRQQLQDVVCAGAAVVGRCPS